jgi:excisionase family DNA binding protein
MQKAHHQREREMKPQILIVSRIQCGTKCEYIGAPSFQASPEHLWSTEEAGQFLGVTKETVRDWCRDRKLTHVRLSPYDIRIRKADLDEFVGSRLNRRKSAFR